MVSLSKQVKENARPKRQPSWLGPELATLVKTPFSDKEWIFEPKLDGVRCLVFKKGSEVHLYSRNRNRLDKTYPELVAAFKKQKCKNFIVDGEIVTFEGKITSFSKLQARLNLKKEEKIAAAKKIKVHFYAFDLPHLEDFDLTKVPLIERKKLLKSVLQYNSIIRYTPHRLKEGVKYFKEASKKGWEGVIAKRANSRYTSRRTKDWQKFKAVNRHEFVIGGYTPPQGSRVGFGALLIGFHEKSGLKFAGKVGTGYNTAFLQKLGKRLQKMERKTCPFKTGKPPSRNAHWVEPKLVAEVEFTEWTRDGKLRHPSFIGLRTDKPAKTIKRERSR